MNHISQKMSPKWTSTSTKIPKPVSCWDNPCKSNLVTFTLSLVQIHFLITVAHFCKIILDICGHDWRRSKIQIFSCPFWDPWWFPRSKTILLGFIIISVLQNLMLFLLLFSDAELFAAIAQTDEEQIRDIINNGKVSKN